MKRLFCSWFLSPINCTKAGGKGGESGREVKLDYERDTLSIHVQETSETKGISSSHMARGLQKTGCFLRWFLRSPGSIAEFVFPRK